MPLHNSPPPVFSGKDRALGRLTVPESATELGERIAKSVGLMPCGDTEDAMRPHLIWNVQQVMSHISPHDMTSEELIALAALLIVPHARWLREAGRPTGIGGRPDLRMVDDTWTI